MNRNTDDMFRTLKPAGLDTMVAEAHARRREQDLSRAWDGDSAVSVPAARRRMPRVLVTGLAVGAAAATAAGVIVATDGSGSTSGGARPTASSGGRIDARTILLASAETAAKAPATTGAYWYVRERETRSFLPKEFSATPKNAAARKKMLTKKRGGDSPSLTALVSGTEESWDGRNRHDRTIVGIDPKITFPTTADEAKWKGMSRRERQQWGLDMTAKPVVNNYDFSKLKLLLNQQDKTVEALAKLPSDPEALERVMRTWFRHENQVAQEHDGKPMPDAFAQYVFGEAQDLLAGPLTPGAKAALYRLLAKQPGIRYLGTATDPMGRKGAVLAMGFGGDAIRQAKTGGEIRLIIDPKTGRLLAQESGDRKSPSLTMTYESMGWVNSLGARP